MGHLAGESAVDSSPVSWPLSHRLRPSLLIIGAQKSGTTSLFKYLSRHPGIRAPRRKEVRYFDVHWSAGGLWYARQFPRQVPLLKARHTIDASPAYLFHPHAGARAARLLPDARIVVLLRDPISRAYSQYQHNRRRGRVSATFEDEMKREPELLAKAMRPAEGVDPLDHAAPGIDFEAYLVSYLERGKYATQLETWLRYFPAERFLVVLAEGFFAAPQRWTNAATALMGLPPRRLRSPGAHRAGGRYDPVAPSTRDRLTEYFIAHNRHLARLLSKHRLAPEIEWPADGTWPGSA